MISIKHVMPCAALAVLLVAISALANEIYTCNRGDMKRAIAVVHTKADSTVPCELTYTKEDGSSQSLWPAQSAAGYYEEKAAAFAEKLRGLSWECAKQ
ncbi:MAG: hypothetical protein WA632_09900 [Gallionella sp.]